MRLRVGWTLAEMMVSLAVTGSIFVLTSTAALGHLRWVRGAGEIAALRSQLGHATAIATSVLGEVESPTDILIAQDSAAEVMATYGVAFACRADTGRLLIAAPPSGTDSPLGAFGDSPQPGDEVRMLAEDDSSASWIVARVAAAPVPGGACAGFPSASATWVVALAEPYVVSTRAALRFARRTRISSYRASDGRWYLGLREWNGSAGTFNGIQPVAGPLRPVSSDHAVSGFVLSWSDATGVTLETPAPADRIVSVTVTARGETVRPARVNGMTSTAAPKYADSLSATLTFRNRW